MTLPPLPSLPALDPPREPEQATTRLANGMTLHTFPMPWLRETGLTVAVRAGSRFEEERESGAAHFLEHMLFKGTARHPDPTELHEAVESLAGDMNAATGNETNAYWITLPAPCLEAGLDIFCEMFTAPGLHNLDTERRVILAEMREDYNDQGEITNPALLAAPLLWPGHPLARSILGDERTVSRLTRRHLLTFMQRFYTGQNMAAAVFGPVTPQRVHPLLERFFASLPMGTPPVFAPPPPMASGPLWRAVDDQTAQFTLTLSFRTPGYLDPGALTLAALRRLLDDGFSSRLQTGVREKRGLVYDVWAARPCHADSGILELGAQVSPENLLVVFDLLLTEVRALQESPPAPREWQRIQNRWLASLATAADHPAELVDRYVVDPLMGLHDTLTDTWHQVAGLAPESLPDRARQWLRWEHLVVILVGPNAREALPRLQERMPRL
ncbi:MAG: insulinase family protein [Magnetococcus sp. WYHC-3]